ncbi:MAG: hypothetical protein ACFB8W_07855 [Elainellaceae cyanobacterium]
MNHLPLGYELIAAAIPHSWVERIDALTASQGQTRAEWLYDQIAAAIFSASGSGEREAIATLTARLAALEAKMEKMDRCIERQAKTPPTDKQEHQRVSAAVTEADDEFDEPDEVLWSFLSSTAEPASSGQASGSLGGQGETSPTDDIEDEPDEILYSFLDS